CRRGHEALQGHARAHLDRLRRTPQVQLVVRGENGQRIVIVGVPKEIKNGECRAALTPGACAALVSQGIKVWVQAGVGVLAGFPDAQYKKSGARVVSNAKQVWSGADLVLKVKEPQPSEFKLLSKDKTLFCFLHLAAEPAVAKALLRSKTTAFAAECVK